MLYLSSALGVPVNRLRGIFPDPWNLKRIIPTEERGMIDLIVNGIPEKTSSINIYELIIQKRLCPDTVVIELKGKIIKKADWAETKLDQNDKIEILNFVGGG